MAVYRLLKPKIRQFRRVRKATTLQPISEEPLLVNTNTSGIVQVETYTPLGQPDPCMAAPRILYVFSGMPFENLIENAWSSVISLEKNQRVPITCPAFLELIHKGNGQPSSYSLSNRFLNAIHVVHYKRTPDCLKEIYQHRTVQQMRRLPHYQRPARGNDNVQPKRQAGHRVLDIAKRIEVQLWCLIWKDNDLKTPNWIYFWQWPTFAKCTLSSQING